jgi:hypothetical protein
MQFDDRKLKELKMKELKNTMIPLEHMVIHFCATAILWAVILKLLF